MCFALHIHILNNTFNKKLKKGSLGRFYVTCFRCPVGKYWHYHGERCTELVSVPLDPSLIVTCLVGSLCLVCAIIGILIFINKKCVKTRKAVTLVWVGACIFPPKSFFKTVTVPRVAQVYFIHFCMCPYIVGTPLLPMPLRTLWGRTQYLRMMMAS